MSVYTALSILYLYDICRYDRQRERAVFEGSGGPCMNQHVAPAEVAMLPQAEKTKLAAELQVRIRAAPVPSRDNATYISSPITVTWIVIFMPLLLFLFLIG